MRLPRLSAALGAFLLMAVPVIAEESAAAADAAAVTVEATVEKDAVKDLARAAAPAAAAGEGVPGKSAAELPEAETRAAATEAAKAAGTTLPSDAEVKAVEAKAPEAPPPSPTLAIDINLSSQRMVVSENGKAKYTWRVSSGAYGYPTPTGTFRPIWTSKMWYSRKYDMAPMPHSIFFHGGTAIHATSSIGNLGRPASHGCVRLSPSHAATLYKMVGTHGKALTRISVHGKPKYSAPQIAQRRTYEPGYQGYYAAARRPRYATSYYNYSAPPRSRYVYPGDRPAYYVPNTRRGQSGKPRRYVMRQYSPYGY